MDLPGPSNTNSDNELCQLCNSRTKKYTCPRCSIPYCSVECYKASSHLNCSEEFFQECVTSEMKVRSKDPDDRKKMIDILKRFHEQSKDFQDLYGNYEDMLNLDESDASEISGDSDDDNEVPDLSERIKNIDINNVDDLWGILTDAEKQEFKASVLNGDVEKLLPQWVPWWNQVVEKKLVKEIDEEEKPASYEKNCPPIVHISPFSALEKASPLIAYNLLNILYAYILTVLHNNGEHKSSPKEAAELFLQLNDVIGSNKNFENSHSATKSVAEKAIEYEILSNRDEAEELKNVLKKIIEGPEPNKQTYYLSAALSDLHALFSELNDKICNMSQQKKTTPFPKRFKNNLDKKFLNIDKKNIKLYIKKLEYYLAWIDKYGTRLVDVKINE
ncbi:zinc finger HIT domain-containing protein 2 [Chelonus insularis]|uniref:zinc finger HIT domain-containing protein 2 n=1 Tax=Chelonus insularis TaxID=460826 RepID=UPI00158E11EC|nr:zinc finger HIT domain-containing protein 2 [Chelonus insularis]